MRKQKWTARTIAKFRSDLGMQQGELAQRLGITQAYISMLEAGKKVPSKTLCLLLDCLEKEVRR